MSTRIDIEVAQALLSQRAKEIAELNRQQRLERERKVKEEAAINAAADKGAEAALRNGSPGGGRAIGGGAAALDARAQRLGLRSGVPEYYTPPKVAAQQSRKYGEVAAAVLRQSFASGNVTITVRSSDGSASASHTFTPTAISVPDNAWFSGGNGSDVSGDAPVVGNPEPDVYGPSDELPPESSGTAIYREEQFDTRVRTTWTAFALPVGKGLSVLVYHYRRSAIGYLVKIRATLTWANGILDTVATAGGEHTLFGFSSESAVEFSNTQLDSAQQFTKCFLVGTNVVREISTPSGLATAIAKFSRDASDYPTYLVKRGEYDGSGTNSWQFTGTGLDYEPIGTPSSSIDYYVRAFDDTAPARFSDYEDAIPLLLCYGVGALDQANHQRVNNKYFYSPAIFGFLLDLDASFLADIDDYYSNGSYESNLLYSTIGSTFLSSAPAPAAFIGPNILSGGSAQVGVSPNMTIRFDKAIESPVSADMALTVPDDFTQGKQKLKLHGIAGGDEIFVSWDWGHRAYCAQQLQALGFTPGDLQP
jgi:hypothetical protein